ncbi:MAG: hypothetical protein RR840_04970 [Clostridium sp.]
MIFIGPSPKVSDLEVEKRAYDLGMKYPDEIKAFFNNEKKVKGENKSD